MEKSYKRRNIFIKKDLQGKMILSCFLLVTGGGLMFIVLFGFFSADTLTISYSKQGLQMGQTPMMLIKQVLTANWILIAIGGAALVIASMLLSHRIAGPLFRIEKALDRMRAGHLNDTIRLRAKDEGKDLALKLNEFNLQLSQSLRTIKNCSTALQTLIDQTAELDLPMENKDHIASICWAMQEHNRKVINACEAYELKDE
jgi:methyl-accepting chemotaxis protein